MSNIVVTKSSPLLVGPSEPGTPTGSTRLSWFDELSGSSPVSLLLVFDKPIANPAETIRRALSRALVHYYPISGRLAAGSADGDEVVTYTGEGQGVLFVGASASCAVDDEAMSAAPLLSDLYAHYPDELCPSHTDPLLLMQVTEFSCGGFAVGVTWNHIFADGTGIGQLLQAIGELARGMPLPSVAPVRWDESVMTARPRVLTLADVEFLTDEDDMVFLDLTIPPSLIGRVKAEAGSDSERCTVFEAVVAVLWQCRARAVSVPEGHAATSLMFGSNVRGLVSAAEGYYGNCYISESVQATSAHVANSDTKDVVKLIKATKQKLRGAMTKNNDDDGVNSVQQQRLSAYNTLGVSSWRNIGLDAADFGGGRPSRVVLYAMQDIVPFFVLCPPCKGKDGVNVLSRMLKKEHVDRFLHELEALTSTERV
ncbi:hypothetical protein QYE76_006696 [Lolium multiflorum]|uniref:Uncharacterized protein n=1 Tax=Lolium multiflorum TaxID=4521 RepID=A0AAD8RYQ7_LOLMU|nr:hypothetical protein QYE76_006696 [Lolium multiflorum]